MDGLTNKTIAIVCNDVFPAWSPQAVEEGKPGASEEIIVEHSRCLAELGYQVSVYFNGKATTHYGVSYIPINQFNPRQRVDVLIVYKNHLILDMALNAGQIFYWTNETDAVEKLTQTRLRRVELVIAHSRWQSDNLLEEIYSEVVPLGLRDIPKQKKIPRTVLYTSAHDRGLDWLLASWPLVIRQVPDAQLFVTYGTSDHQRPLDQVVYLSSLSRKDMDYWYGVSDIWAYPCHGNETYCQSAAEAQSAGCIPVVIPHMALAETVRHGVFSDKEGFAEDLITALTDEPLRKHLRSLLAQDKWYSWMEATKMLEKLWIK